MSNEVASMEPTPFNVAQELAVLAPSKYADDKVFGAIASTVSFLPRLMLMGATSNAVKEGKIGMGRWGFVRGKDQIEDLTPETTVLVLSWRPKAMKIDKDVVTSVYNHKSKTFSEIAALADSGKQDTGCMYGPEFLVWLPTLGVFGSYFMSSKTSRREAPNLKGLMFKSALLRIQLIKSGKHTWHGPVVSMYSQPLASMPNREDTTEQVMKFNNPPETEQEEAPPEDETRAR
jgi:hypothetical protein